MKFSKRSLEGASELNIVPIVDALVVMVAYLLIGVGSVGLGSLSVRSAGLVPSEHDSHANGVPLSQLALELKESNAVEVYLEGPQVYSASIPPLANGSPDWERVSAMVQSFKERTSLSNINVLADDNVPYAKITLATSHLNPLLPVTLAVRGKK